MIHLLKNRSRDSRVAFFFDSFPTSFAALPLERVMALGVTCSPNDETFHSWDESISFARNKFSFVGRIQPHVALLAFHSSSRLLIV